MAVASLWCGRPTMVMPSTRTCYGNNQHIHACSHLRLKLGLEIHGFVSFLPCKSQRFPSRYVKLPQSVSASLSSECSVARPPWQCIVLDIEGTTTPISFVTDVLFPYAHESVHSHLALTYDSKETQDDIRLLREQVQTDIDQGVEGIVPIPSDDAGKDAIIQSLVTNVEAMIKADRKVRALKELQGHIWRTGFQKKDLQSVLFDDVYDALKKWHQSDIKIYIYSSGSREAQKLIFANTIYGDLRKYLCGFFDTKIGYKRETQSFSEIFQYVGVDTPTQILFITDVYEEALAAKAAGLQVMVSIRPGNAPLPEGHGFKTIRSFAEI